MVKPIKNNLISLIICSVFIYSCGKSDDEIRKEKREQIKQKVEEFAYKNKAEVSIDTLNFNYTFEYQILTSDNPRILIPNFQIDDIFVKNGKVYLFGTSNYTKYFYELSAPTQIIKKINDDLEYSDRINLIIQNSNFKKLTIQVSPDYDFYSYSESDLYTEDDIDIDTYLTLDNYSSNDFLVTGEVKKYQIIKD